MDEKDKPSVKEAEASGEEDEASFVSENTGMASSTGDNQEGTSLICNNDEVRQNDMNNSRYLESTDKTPDTEAATATHGFVAELDSKEELSTQEKSHSGSAAESIEYPQSIMSASPSRLSNQDNTTFTTATNTTTSTSIQRSEASNKRLQGRTEKMGALFQNISSAKHPGGSSGSDRPSMESQSESSDSLVPGAFPVRGRAYGGLPSWSFNQSTSLIPKRPQRHASQRITSDEISMIRNNDESAEEPDDDVEDARRYTESQRNRNVVSSVVTRLSNHSNQSNRSEETSQPEMEHIEILEAELVTEHDDFHEQPVFLATEIESTFTKLFKDKRFCRPVVLFSVLMCILVAFFVARDWRSRSSNTRSDTSAPSTSPTLSPTVNSDNLQLVLERLSKKEDLEQIGSPQRKALLWLANIDSIDIEPEDPLFPQRYALVVIFYATQPGNGSWLQQGDWLSPTAHECDWDESIYCDPEITGANHVKILNLEKNGLAGTLPPEIGLLTDLEHLILSDNTVQGTIPASIGALSLLTDFDLSMNELSGIIPDTIGNFKFLRYLFLSGNMLMGTIPDTLYSLDQLKEIDLGENELTGTITDKQKNLNFLHTMRLSNNKLSGSVPTTLSGMQDLNVIVLDHNKFTGSLPDIQVMAFRLEVLSVSNNFFEGTLPIPKNVAEVNFTTGERNTIRLRKVDVSNNKLVGTLSSILGYIPDLEYLDFSGNSFSGTISPMISFIDNLKIFRVSNNKLTGSVPQFGQVQRLKEFKTEGNDLSHSFGDLILNQNQLEVLSISGRCGQTIPAEISKMTNLRFLNASNCDFGGTLPNSIGQMMQLAQLHLEGNRFTGPIPTEFETLNVLTDLNLANNTLSKTIPQSLGNMEKLRVLSLSNNQLTGSIPSQLSSLQDLEKCHLGGNALKGPVPEELCSRTSLQLEVDSSMQCGCCTGDN